MSVELRHLRYFVAVAQEGQISSAARRLFIAQPSLSHAMGDLEGRLGTRLFVRGPAGITLTAAGRHLFPRAERLVALADDVCASTRRVAEPAAVTVGVVPYMLGELAELLAELGAETPRVTANVRTVDFAEHLVDVETGSLDALLAPYLPAGRDLHVQPMGESPAVVLMARDHPLARLDRLRFDDLAGETWPGRHRSVPQTWADACWLTARRGSRPRVTAEAPLTPDELWGLLASGRAITVAPGWLARAFAALHPAGEHAPVTSRPLADVEPFPLVLVGNRVAADGPAQALFGAARRLAERRALPSGTPVH